MAKNSTGKALLGLLVLVAVLAIGADRGAVYFAQSVGAVSYTHLTLPTTERV